MLLGIAVIAYLLGTVALGLWASRRVHGAKDFMVAGRSLPLYMNFACVFATWFGAETVLSVSATATKHGLSGVSADPFGASFCLILVAVFFAKAFYRLDLLTIGDFYRKRYGRTVEIFTAIVITISYLSWTSAQITALGLVMHVLADASFPGSLTLNQSILIGALVVVVYTLKGGMWSVALTDLLQTSVIIVGLIIIALYLSGVAGGVGNVIAHARDAGKLRLLPENNTAAWLAFITPFLTMGLGSIPQQDVFQRVTSAKDEKTAIRGTMLGGLFYFFFAFVPMFIAYSAVVIDADKYTELFSHEDARHVQRILPDLILSKTPFLIQALFFGSLLSAILSTASGTLLAPSSLFTENVVRSIFPELNDQRVLLTLRISLFVFAVIATYVALTTQDTMYEMVENAYTVTLVGALAPLVLGIYWKRATTQGAVCSLLFGVGAWLLWDHQYGEEAVVPAKLCGLVASFVGMVFGSLIPQAIPTLPPLEISTSAASAESVEKPSESHV